MTELKNKENNGSAEEFLKSLPVEKRRSDSRVILEKMNFNYLDKMSGNKK
jgi:hypothetical protein